MESPSVPALNNATESPLPVPYCVTFKAGPVPAFGLSAIVVSIFGI